MANPETQDFADASRQAPVPPRPEHTWQEPLHVVLRAQTATPRVPTLRQLQGS